MTTVLRLDHVTKAFGPVKVIQDVSVDVIPGRVRVLLGENGAGKTTLIKMMSGIYHPDSGSVVIDDTPVELPTVKAAEARGIATIHQNLISFRRCRWLRTSCLDAPPAGAGW